MPIINCFNREKIYLDTDKYEIAKNYSWRIENATRGQIAITSINGRRHSLSRIVFGLKSGQYLFRKNSDILDFRKENVIICENGSQLMHLVNQKNKNSTSQYFGVYFNSTKRKWLVDVNYKENRFNGQFDTEFDAAIMADFFYRKHFGRAINFPNISQNSFMKLYEEIIFKYGETRAKKISKSLQGIRKNKIKSSKYVGVSKNKRLDKWVAQICFEGKQNRLGFFYDEQQAAEAYDKAAIELFGQNAKINFPDSLPKRKRKNKLKKQ